MELSDSKRFLCPTVLLFALTFSRNSGQIIDGYDISADAGDDYQEFNVSASYATAAADVAANNLTSTYRSGYESGAPITDSDLQCLSELPVEKLLRIRKTLRFVSQMLDGVEQPVRHSWAAATNGRLNRTGGGFDENRRMQGGVGYGSQSHRAMEGAHASALMMDGIKEKVGYDEPSHGWVEEKPSKVQKIFQMSVTTLAFLAFGGYLLCMIVQAIKSKGTTYYHPQYLPMVTSTGGEGSLNQISTISIRKRRPVRLRRSVFEVRTDEGRGSEEEKTPTDRMATPSPDELYNMLAMAAEGYVRFSAR